MEKRNLVQVRYRGRRSGKFEGDAYTYVADVPLEVGDIVNVPTKYGPGLPGECAGRGDPRMVRDAPAYHRGCCASGYVFRIFCLGGATGGNPDF